ncbi:RNA polymerase sigma factor WhiG [Anatilimnocola aggregata]|uniref:RNA polymerase sigma factor WhiG n=1 Tax=Anatilimnocola aggregata TaxID=2528021 RepID=A0A517YIW6_9BACT|nr:sigma-70 family RNA polymerase sigma factor [Anatilimnocola aggregata]QDU30155.1 RNA polymerase sigma factor WhiG [Anatilimnocola aggregata]
MDPAATVELQLLLDRLRAGDEQARREFLERACERLRRLAGKILSGSFPQVQRRHEVDSIVHETWFRLVQAMEKADPPTVADFFRLAAHKIRQVLLDMVATERRGGHQHETLVPNNDSFASRHEPADHSLDGARLAVWTEFHNKVGKLAEAERTIFEMHYYLGLPQAEIARILELHPRKVSYLWVSATEELAGDLTQIARL